MKALICLSVCVIQTARLQLQSGDLLTNQNLTTPEWLLKRAVSFVCESLPDLLQACCSCKLLEFGAFTQDQNHLLPTAFQRRMFG